MPCPSLACSLIFADSYVSLALVRRSLTKPPKVLSTTSPWVFRILYYHAAIDTSRVNIIVFLILLSYEYGILSGT